MQLRGKVLLTGGSGYLGRAILRRAKREAWPASFTVYSRDEAKQWDLQRKYPGTRCVLGDVSRNLERLIDVCQGHDTIIHMAAVKFIPEAEHNVFETIEVNINGSRNVILAAKAAGVRTVVGISTDKACAPANVYGMTKAVMERMFGEAARTATGVNFLTARYGNVIGSTGSVIPVFKRQIEDDSQVKVTDSRMTRFWLTVDQAIDLILWCAEEADKFNGSTLIPYCPAMKIDDIAKAVWAMNKAGEPNIIYSGIRPGEKLHEALFNEQEAPRITVIGQQGFALAPATTQGVVMPEMMAYTSDHPSHWVTQHEMIGAIQDAESV